jgi:radical SAM family uncharacterized protein/radical SAM-linked protein
MRHIYADFIDRVAKPVRYLGGEYQQVVKDHGAVDARIVMAFPDVYEIGMSHLGTKILYSVLNRNPRIACERCFTPWVDMEAELRARDLPLVSLETCTPLSDFDVVGVSLQYELTYTNALTMLDLGGIALRAADRADGAPLVLGGGPTATHPEPLAPFFDAFFIGEGEELLGDLVLAWAEMRRRAAPRLDALAELASNFPLYVPALYDTQIDRDSGLVVVGNPRDARAPQLVQRAMVERLDDYPFPSDAPVPYAEAVFDRAAIEIARGCTEGCRFCQAGMIYRPVRERDPLSVVDSIVANVERGGYDESSLTSLSTADYSCITPLVAKVASELRARKVSLSVSSLRAYGLNEDVLDELASVRATGLTFAPEAGTQRMRDVVNKNVTEAHVEQSAHRVFARGWNRLKLYFMIGLPTERDEDVIGIVDTGQRMLAVGRQHVGRRAEVTVSVSSHVPKPHTPFQWCAMDDLEEIGRKQRLLRDAARQTGIRLKYHDAGISFVEGVFARGDRRVGDALELAWRRGARFDGWDELFNLDRWHQVFAELELPVDAYLRTIPVTSRLPWDHIDVGLEDGFLLSEYRKALKDRLSPPCGKPVGDIIHHTNLQDAEPDQRKLVCYDCGVACDLTQMRDERLVALRRLGAQRRPEPRFVAEDLAASAAEPEPRRQKRKWKAPQPRVTFPQVPSFRYRITYTKLGRVAFLGHLDVARVLARLFRRAGVPVAYSQGFHPKPVMEFGPALSLGVPSLGEVFDVAIEHELAADELRSRLCEVAPPGLEITSAAALPVGFRRLSKLIESCDLLVLPAPDGIAFDAARLGRIGSALLARDQVLVQRKDKPIDVRTFVQRVDVIDQALAAELCGALDWPVAPALLRVRLEVGPGGSAKPVEVAQALGVGGGKGPLAPRAQVARLGFPGLGGLNDELEPVAPAGGVTILPSITSAKELELS